MKTKRTIYEMTHLDGQTFSTTNPEIFHSYANLLYDFKPWAIYKFKTLFRTNKWWIVYYPTIMCASKFDSLYDALKELYCVTNILENKHISWKEHKDENPGLKQYGYKPLYILYLIISFCKSFKRLFNFKLKQRIKILRFDIDIFFEKEDSKRKAKYAQQVNNIFKLLKDEENEN